MTCYVKFLWYNLVDQDATELSADAEDAFFVANNLKDHRRSKVFRTPDGTTDLGVTFDFKTIEAVTTVFVETGVDGLQFTGDLTIKANNSDTGWGTPAFSTTVTPNDTFARGFVTFPEENYRYWRIENNSPGADYVELSSVFIGNHLDLSESNSNIDFGWQQNNEDLSKIQKNRYGERFIDRITNISSISAAFNFIDKDELAKLMEMFFYCGTSRPVWHIIDEDALISDEKERFAIYGFFTGVPDPINTNFGLYGLEYEIEE